MSTIIVKGPEQAIRAGTWAENNLKTEWSMDFATGNPFGPRPEYAFRFANSKDAALFALKWVK